MPWPRTTARSTRPNQVQNEAIVIPGTLDGISALSELEPNGTASIAKTDATLGICKSLLPATARPISEAAPLERPVVG
jgi:hypothetical protein